MLKYIVGISFVAAVAVSVPASAAEVLVNGEFDSGLTGWTSYTTSANGTISEVPSTFGSPQPQVAKTASFDVDGSGASDALFLNVGKINPPFFGSYEGGGVFQAFSLARAGAATFSVDIASFYSRTSGALDLGKFSVLIDGVALDTHDFGGVASGPATLCSSLSFATNLSAGNHTLSLQATRQFAPGLGVTSEYFDHATLDFVPVPEPTTWALMLSGFGGLGGVLRRRRRVAGLA